MASKRKHFLEPGKSYHHLTLVRQDGKNKFGHPMWVCQCVCGNEKTTSSVCLIQGRCKSYGCKSARAARDGKEKAALERMPLGSTFGDLTTTKVRRKNGALSWLCRCQCGNEVVLTTAELRGVAEFHGSCGCKARGGNYVHGGARGGFLSLEYVSYHSMLRRCFKAGTPGFEYWGGRGITVCRRWRRKKTGFVRFFEKLGTRPSSKHSIDRIDNDGHYSCGDCSECKANGWPFNCRWATAKEQANNKRKPTGRKGSTK